MENITLENIMATPGAWIPLVVGYIVFFWLLPMGMLINTKNIPSDQLMPYWKAVRQVSGIFHLGAIISTIIIWLMQPYLVLG